MGFFNLGIFLALFGKVKNRVKRVNIRSMLLLTKGVMLILSVSYYSTHHTQDRQEEQDGACERWLQLNDTILLQQLL